MIIAIRNNKNEDHKIMRLNGLYEVIPANDYLLLELTLPNEISYWDSLKDEYVTRLGLSILKDSKSISAVKKIIEARKLRESITVDNIVEKLAKLEDKMESPINMHSVSTTNVEDDKDNVSTTVEETVEEQPTEQYTEEILSKKTKAELQEILNTMGVSYKSNSTKSTLIQLILE